MRAMRAARELSFETAIEVETIASAFAASATVRCRTGPVIEHVSAGNWATVTIDADVVSWSTPPITVSPRTRAALATRAAPAATDRPVEGPLTRVLRRALR
jgi:hypothetical protein